jgi:uncharacterized membrane protein SirB2
MWMVIKHLHITLVVISVGGFVLRGVLMLLQSKILQQRWIKRLPHIVDTLLFASGIFLAWSSHQYPFVNSYWLTSKMLALVAYIGFGMLALNYGRNRIIRGIAMVVACGCAAYMIVTATGRNGLVFA